MPAAGLHAAAEPSCLWSSPGPTLVWQLEVRCRMDTTVAACSSGFGQCMQVSVFLMRQQQADERHNRVTPGARWDLPTV